MGEKRRVLFFQYPHCRGRAEHHSDFVFFNQAPPDATVRASRQTLIHDGRHAGYQGAVNDVTVAHYPADVAGSKKSFACIAAKNMFHARGQRHGITAGVALHAFGVARGAAGVQRVAGVGGVHPLARHHGVHVFVPQGAPHLVASSLQIHRNQASINQQNRRWLVAGQANGLIQQGLVRHRFAAPRAGIGTHHHRGRGIFNARGQRTGGKAAKHDRMNGANAGTSQHGKGRLGNHGHVNQDAVILFYTQLQKRCSHALNLCVQLAKAVDLFLVGLGGHTNQRGLFGTVFQMAVHCVVAQICRAADKPLGKRGVAVITNLHGRRVPVNQLGLLGPESIALVERATVKVSVRCHGFASCKS